MKKMLIIIWLAFLAVAPLSFLSKGHTYALDDATKNAACKAIPGGGDCSATGNGSKIQDNINSVINIFSWLVGVASVFMIILGGFKFVTSGGDSGKIASARNNIIYAVVGIVEVAVAQIIVHFVLGKTNG